MRNKTFASLAAVILVMGAGMGRAATLLSGPGGYLADEFGPGSYLGVDTRDITSDRLGALKLKEERGVEITMVDQDAPAGKAGLKEHDVILSFNGNNVESVEQLRRMIHETPPGRVVSLGISREGQPMTIKAQLAQRRGMLAMGPHTPMAPLGPVVTPTPPMPPMSNFDFPDIDMPAFDVVVHSTVRGGLMVENLTPQLGDFLGAKNGEGVLVRSVEKGSAAERAGFHAGDVITKVGNERVSDTNDWRRVMRAHRAGKVTIGIVRDHKAQTLSFVVPKQTGRATALELELPEITARVDMRNAHDQLERARPQIEAARREMQKQAVVLNKQVREQARRGVEQARHEIEAHRGEWEKQMRDAQREFQLQQKELEKEMRELGRSLEEI